jgi:nucleoside 2-deoxyribosyltransferase
LKDTGFTSRRIDKKQFNDEISGEILSEISKSRFMIADVTGQRNGVYFEAGFAMGKNQPVIFCCQEDDLAKVHFDTRQYNHIIWKDTDDLYVKLKDRILGTILLGDS